MKLRINGNSVRLRLGQSEVRRLAIEGVVEDATAFGPSKGQHFDYALYACPDELSVSAAVTERHIVVRAPAEVIRRWVATDQVSIHGCQRTGDGGELRILIEKDFRCIDATADESQEDAFTHPQFGAAVCMPTGVIARPA